MKRALLFAALLAALSPLAIHTAEANSATIDLAPGVSLRLGDRDNRGHYWDGGRWRDGRWWNDRYRYDNHRWWRQDEWRRQQAWEREHRRRAWERDRYDFRGPPPPGWHHRGRDRDRDGWRDDRHHDRRGPPDGDRRR